MADKEREASVQNNSNVSKDPRVLNLSLQKQEFIYKEAENFPNPEELHNYKITLGDVFFNRLFTRFEKQHSHNICYGYFDRLASFFITLLNKLGYLAMFGAGLYFSYGLFLEKQYGYFLTALLFTFLIPSLFLNPQLIKLVLESFIIIKQNGVNSQNKKQHNKKRK